jgi:hypothetical protein
MLCIQESKFHFCNLTLRYPGFHSKVFLAHQKVHSQMPETTPHRYFRPCFLKCMRKAPAALKTAQVCDFT